MGFGFTRGPGRYATVLTAVVLGVGAMLAPVAGAASAQAAQRPLTGALESELYGASCTSASACTAVGDYENSGGTFVSLAERWNGTAWSSQTSANPSGSSATYLNAVSCASATACTAVGNYVSGVGGSVTLAEAWNGTTWSVQTTPNPSGATSSFLEAVSCTSTSACTAVGYYFSSGTYETLAEAWNGTTWSLQTTATPSGAIDSVLNGVSCTSASACIATGYYENSTGTTNTLAEVWNGTTWTVQTTANPTGSTDSELYGVSCTSASACTSTGDYVTSGGATVTLAEVWNGTTWTIQTTANPTGAVAAFLDGVSCTSASACTAVGWYETSPGAYETLAERWNGTSWAIQTTPNPSGASASYLFAVSCGSATACAAVGYSLDPSYTALAEGWNGTTWSLQTTPVP
jgi:hypothetical protein